MVSTRKERTLVVIELNGGNDALNTVVPFNNSLYYDHRPGIGIAQQDVMPLGSKGEAGDYGLNPNMAAVKDLWDAGKLAVINGIGYPQPNAPTSARGTSGTPRSRSPSAPKAGWARPSATWTPRARTC